MNFELGKIFISEEAVRKYPLDFIFNKLNEYKLLAENHIDERDTQNRIISGKVFKKEFLENNFPILYIETIRVGRETIILEGMEYIERDLKNFAFELHRRERNFLKVVLNCYTEEGSSYEKRKAMTIINKIEELEKKRGYLEEKETEGVEDV